MQARAAFSRVAQAAGRVLSRLFQPATEKKPIGLRARLDRGARVAGGFLLSILILGGVSLFIVETASRPLLDTAPIASTPEDGARTVSAAQALLSLRAQRDLDLAADRLLATAALRQREAQVFGAAEQVAQLYIGALIEVRRGARDPLLAAARLENSAAPAQQAEALARMNAAVARRQIVIDRSDEAFRRLAAAAADSCAARAARLQQFQRGDDADAAFHAARGEAYAWLLLLRAAAEDSRETAILDAPSYQRLIDALERAARRRPVLFLRDARGGMFAPNALAEIGLDLAVAAQAAWALSSS